MDQEGGLRVDEDVKLIVDYLKDYRDYIDKRLAKHKLPEDLKSLI